MHMYSYARFDSKSKGVNAAALKKMNILSHSVTISAEFGATP